MENRLTSWGIRKMQIKTAVRCRLAKVRKTRKKRENVSEDVGKGEASDQLGASSRR